MRRRFRRTRRHAELEPVLTPLIDVTFLLIVFFVMVSRLDEVQAVDLNLPTPKNAQSAPPEPEDQVAVSVRPGPNGTTVGYRVGAVDFSPDAAGLERLTAHLRDMYAVNPHIHLNLRADRATKFELVEPLMEAVSRAVREARAAGGTAIDPRVNIMVQKE